MSSERTVFQGVKQLLKGEILFCELSPLCYNISEKKGNAKRHISDFFSKEKIAKEKSDKLLPFSVYSHESGLIKKGKGIDPETQYNKAHNIAIASSTINGIVIHPGETFSFWRTGGAITE